MKKVLFFLSTIFLLSACSNDNDPINSGNTDDIKYPITLNIETPKIEIETSTLRALTPIADGDPILYYLVIYKENGEIYYTYDYLVEPGYNSSNGLGADNIFISDGANISTALLLPAGNYHIAMMIHRKDSKHPNTTINPLAGPLINYNVDFFNPVNIYESIYHNGGVYFNTADLSVVTSETAQNLSMELQPMWSYIDVNIEDAQTFEVPEGTNSLQFVVNPLYYGFNVKSKLAPFIDDRPIIFSLDSIRTNPAFNLRTTVSKSVADNTISTSIKFLKIDGDTTVLETKQLPIPSSNLENGFYYNIHGSLSKNAGQSMNISLGEFNKEDVNIEF